MKMDKEKVIIRREYDPYMKIWKWLCIFPETYEGNNTWGCIPIWKDGHGQWWSECYTAGTLDYFYKCKIVHKNTPEAAEVIEGLKKFCDGEYEVVEKMKWRW